MAPWTTPRLSRIAYLVAVLAGGTALAATSAGVSGTLLGEAARGVVPIDPGTRTVEVAGLRGSLTVRRSETPHELRFTSDASGGARDALPMDVRSDGATIRLRPRAGEEAIPRAVAVWVPDELDLRLRLEGTQVDVLDAPGDLDVEGKGLALQVRGVRGRTVVDLEGGSALLAGLGGNVVVRGKSLDLTLDKADKEVRLFLAGGTAHVSAARRGLEADTDGTMLTVERSGLATVDGRRGKLALRAVAGATLSLAGTPLTLAEVQGDVDVQTDADVSFQNTQASLHVDGYAAAVRGSGNAGLVEVRTQNAPVDLQKIDGPLRIEGEGLQVKLQDLSGETLVYTRSSDVSVTSSRAHLVVDSKDGNVAVRKAEAPVEVRASGGTVKLLDLRAPATLEADAKSAEVSWAVLPGDGDSSLTNVGGDIRVRFPAKGSCRIEARSKSGRIDNEMTGVDLGPEGDAVSGSIGGGGKTIRVDSDWSIELAGGPPPPQVSSF